MADGPDNEIKAEADLLTGDLLDDGGLDGFLGDDAGDIGELFGNTDASDLFEAPSETMPPPIPRSGGPTVEPEPPIEAVSEPRAPSETETSAGQPAQLTEAGDHEFVDEPTIRTFDDHDSSEHSDEIVAMAAEAAGLTEGGEAGPAVVELREHEPATERQEGASEAFNDEEPAPELVTYEPELLSVSLVPTESTQLAARGAGESSGPTLARSDAAPSGEDLFAMIESREVEARTGSMRDALRDTGAHSAMNLGVERVPEKPEPVQMDGGTHQVRTNGAPVRLSLGWGTNTSDEPSTPPTDATKPATHESEAAGAPDAQRAVVNVQMASQRPTGPVIPDVIETRRSPILLFAAVGIVCAFVGIAVAAMFVAYVLI